MEADVTSMTVYIVCLSLYTANAAIHTALVMISSVFTLLAWDNIAAKAGGDG